MSIPGKTLLEEAVYASSTSERARGKARVLLVDDDARLLQSLRRRLQEYFEIQLAATGREALSLMHASAPFAAIVADMTMPGMDGTTLLGEVKRSFPGTVRLMLTGHDEREVVSRAVNECEVFRFLTKPCPPAELEKALEDAVELHEQWLAVEHAADPSAPGRPQGSRAFLSSRRFDTTSGLADRRTFEADVLAALGERNAQARHSVLIHIDVDNFRFVNESWGFVAGDSLLRHVAELIVHALGSPAHVARLSADEFGILLSGPSADDAEQTCKRLLDAIAASDFSWDDQHLPISACAGVVPLSPQIEGVAAWLSSAEAACAAAKQFGVGRQHVSLADDPQLARHHRERLALSKVEWALQGNHFKLMFQRIVPLQVADDGRLHFELLLRMVDKCGSLLSPAAFIPAAERYHRAAAVDRWVVRNALEWLAADTKRLSRISMCSINLSAGSLCDPDFVSFLVQILRTSNVPSDRICLEITETAAMAEMDVAAQVIRDLRSLGVHFALDDFGSGQCSFAYLKNLPVDYLKIDGAFVKQLDRDPTSRAMVQSINQIGQVNGKRTIAEFVENEAIANVLRRMGVDFAQGYGIHRPEALEGM